MFLSAHHSAGMYNSMYVATMNLNLTSHPSRCRTDAGWTSKTFFLSGVNNSSDSMADTSSCLVDSSTARVVFRLVICCGVGLVGTGRCSTFHICTDQAEHRTCPSICTNVARSALPRGNLTTVVNHHHHHNHSLLASRRLLGKQTASGLETQHAAQGHASGVRCNERHNVCMVLHGSLAERSLVFGTWAHSMDVLTPDGCAGLGAKLT